MSTPFENAVFGLERLGLTDVILPFLLIFTVVFAVLEKSRVLGEEKRNLNTLIAIIFALVVVIPHVTGDYPLGVDPIEIMNDALPHVSLLLVAIISLMILIGVFAHDRIFLGLTMPGWIAFFSIVAILFIFGSAAGWWAHGFENFLEDMFGSDIISGVIMILVLGVIIAFITGGTENEKSGAALQKVGINLGELFGGKK